MHYITIEMAMTLVGTENYGSSSLRNRYILMDDGHVQSSPVVRQWSSLDQFFRVMNFTVNYR